MRFFEWLSDFGNRYIVEMGITVGGETIPYMVILLLGTGVFLTLRLGFIQIRRLVTELPVDLSQAAASETVLPGAEIDEDQAGVGLSADYRGQRPAHVGHRRERHTAVAEEHRGHAVPAARRHHRVPTDLGVEVGVQIDESRRHDTAGGVDLRGESFGRGDLY